MQDRVRKRRLFPTAHDDAKAARTYMESLPSMSPSYKLAFQDEDFLLRDELRPVRLQLEVLGTGAGQNPVVSEHVPADLSFSVTGL